MAPKQSRQPARAVPCEFCGQMFFPASLKFHRKTCQEKQQKVIMECPYCGSEMPCSELDGHVQNCKAAQKQLQQKRKERGGIRVCEDGAEESVGDLPGPIRLPDGRMRCQFCDRGFSIDRIHKHVSICGKLKKAPKEISRGAVADSLIEVSVMSSGAVRQESTSTTASTAPSGAPKRSPAAASRRLASNGTRDLREPRKPLVTRANARQSKERQELQQSNSVRSNSSLQQTSNSRPLWQANRDFQLKEEQASSGNWRAKHQEVVAAIRNARIAATKGVEPPSFFAAKAEDEATADDNQACSSPSSSVRAPVSCKSEVSTQSRRRSQSQRSQSQRGQRLSSASAKRPSPKPQSATSRTFNGDDSIGSTESSVARHASAPSRDVAARSIRPGVRTVSSAAALASDGADVAQRAGAAVTDRRPFSGASAASSSAAAGTATPGSECSVDEALRPGTGVHTDALRARAAAAASGTSAPSSNCGSDEDYRAAEALAARLEGALMPFSTNTQTVWEPTAQVVAPEPPQVVMPQPGGKLMVNRRASESDLPTTSIRTPTTPTFRTASGRQPQRNHIGGTPQKMASVVELQSVPPLWEPPAPSPALVHRSASYCANGRSARPNAKAEDAVPQRISAFGGDVELMPGVTVQVQGLSNASHLNGLSALLLDFDADANCWLSRLDTGEVKALKPENIVSQASVGHYIDEANPERKNSIGSPQSPRPQPSRSASYTTDAKVPVATVWHGSEQARPLVTRMVPQVQHLDTGDLLSDAGSLLTRPGQDIPAQPSRIAAPPSAGRPTLRGVPISPSGPTLSARESPGPSSRMKSPRAGRRPASPPTARPAAASPIPTRHPGLSPAISQRGVIGGHMNSLSAPTPMVAQRIPRSPMTAWGAAAQRSMVSLNQSMDALRSGMEARACQPRHIGGQGTPARTLNTAAQSHPPVAGLHFIGMVPPPLRPSIQYT